MKAVRNWWLYKIRYGPWYEVKQALREFPLQIIEKKTLRALEADRRNYVHLRQEHDATLAATGKLIEEWTRTSLRLQPNTRVFSLYVSFSESFIRMDNIREAMPYVGKMLVAKLDRELATIDFAKASRVDTGPKGEPLYERRLW